MKIEAGRGMLWIPMKKMSSVSNGRSTSDLIAMDPLMVSPA